MKRSGFSLIEILISSSLIFFLLTCSAQLILISLMAKRNADFHLGASILAHSRLEALKSLSFDSPILKQGSYAEAQRCPITGETLLAEWIIDDINEQTKRVLFTVSRPSSSKKGHFVLLFSRELDF